MSNDFIPYRKIPRLNREILILEKIDGTNAQILINPCNNADKQAVCSLPMDVRMGDGAAPSKIFYNVYAGSRTRWITPVNDNYGFAAWVLSHAYDLVSILGVGRFYGEWWGKGIQRGYGLEEKRFSLFNPDFEFKRTPNGLVHTVPVLYRGPFDLFAIQRAMDDLAFGGSQAAPGWKIPEGIVIYHTASGHLYKKTFFNDEGGKNE